MTFLPAFAAGAVGCEGGGVNTKSATKPGVARAGSRYPKAHVIAIAKPECLTTIVRALRRRAGEFGWMTHPRTRRRTRW